MDQNLLKSRHEKPSHKVAQRNTIITFDYTSLTTNHQGYITVLIGLAIFDCMQFVSHWYTHDDVIKWKHLPRYWPFLRGIHQSPVNSPHKGQWRGASSFSLICAWINGSVNNREAGHFIRHRGHYDVIVMMWIIYIDLSCSVWRWSKRLIPQQPASNRGSEGVFSNPVRDGTHP